MNNLYPTGVPEQHPLVLLLSPHCSYRLAPYLKAAEKLGINTIVASQGEYSLVSAAASGIHIDFDHPQACEQLLNATQHNDIKAVIGTDDRTVELAALVSRALGLTYNDPQAIRYTRRKDLARICLKKSSLNVPEFQICEIDRLLAGENCTPSYPVVIKPLALSGSRGVIRADTQTALIDAAQRLHIILEQVTNKTEKQYVLVESFIPGYEYAYEGLLNNGQLQTLTIFDKPDLMVGPYFEETYYITPSRLTSEQQQAIRQAVETACKAYGLLQGPIHAEVKLHDNKIWFIEMASRTVGGQCARLFSYATGLTLEETVLAQAVGMKLDQPPIQQGAGVLMLPIQQHGLLRRTEGLLEASKVPYIEDIEISIHEGYEIIPLPEGDSYLGFMFAKAPTAAQAEQALRTAYEKITVVTSPLLHKVG